MRKKYLLLLGSLFLLGFILFLVLFPYESEFPVLQPKGAIGVKERDLLFIASALMALIGIPVVIFSFVFVWKYREGNRKAKYDPEWDYNLLAESLWWGIPLVVASILGVICWKTTHELDPFKPLVNGKKPVTIQVVALQWKWLFIYPEEKIAMVNYLQFPEKTPLNFEISADAPMNSFWIPSLGSQIYAMPGMTTKLHLIADEVGTFRGLSANLSGRGFAGMTFVAKATSEQEYAAWVQSVRQSAPKLGFDAYHQLAEPSEYHPVSSYLLGEENLFEWIVMKPMMQK